MTRTSQPAVFPPDTPRPVSLSRVTPTSPADSCASRQARMPTETTSPPSRAPFALARAVYSTSAPWSEASPKPVPRSSDLLGRRFNLRGSPGFKPVPSLAVAVPIIDPLLHKEVLRKAVRRRAGDVTVLPRRLRNGEIPAQRQFVTTRWACRAGCSASGFRSTMWVAKVVLAVLSRGGVAPVVARQRSLILADRLAYPPLTQ